MHEYEGTSSYYLHHGIQILNQCTLLTKQLQVTFINNLRPASIAK